MTLWGWAAVIEYTKLNDQLLRRAMGHYGFPKPVRVPHNGRTVCVWDQPLVSEWLRRSHMLYFMQNRRTQLRMQAEQCQTSK